MGCYPIIGSGKNLLHRDSNPSYPLRGCRLLPGRARNSATCAQPLQIRSAEAPIAQRLLGILTRPAGGRWIALGVRLKRGAGWITPFSSTKVPTLTIIRMARRLFHAEHEREADVAALHDAAPFVARLGAEQLGDPLLHRGPRFAVKLPGCRCSRNWSRETDNLLRLLYHTDQPVTFGDRVGDHSVGFSEFQGRAETRVFNAR